MRCADGTYNTAAERDVPGHLTLTDAHQMRRSCAPSVGARSCSRRSSGVTTGVSAGRCSRTSATFTFWMAGSGYSLAR